MGATTGFDTYYGDNPIAALDQNQRAWYHPILDTMFRQQSVFTGLVRYYRNLGAVNAKTMTITQILDVHPDFDPLGLRDIWMPASHVDSRNVEVTFSRYGGKVAYHEYDDLITYWKANEAGGWRSILTGQLGQHMVGVHDMIARNAFLNLPFKIHANSAADFSELTTTADQMSLGISDDIWLGFGYRDVPMAIDPNLPMGGNGSIFCLTTPGVIYDLRKGVTDNEDWLPVVKYADPKRVLNYEVGMYGGVRYAMNPRLTLWNCGNVAVRLNVTSAITAGDGALDPEGVTKTDGTYSVGQKGVTHSIATGSTGSLNVGDIVTVHTSTTTGWGVDATGAHGVDFDDGKLHNRRIVAKGANTLTFDLPIMVDFDTEIETGVYAYVTKGVHIHASIFIGGPDAVVGGVGRAPVVKAPPPVDDFGQIFRFSWNGYEGFNNYRPEVAEVVFSTGTIRVKGAKQSPASP